MDLKLARWTGLAWTVQTVDATGTVGYDASLALGSNGYPCISYVDFTNSSLKYASSRAAPPTGSIIINNGDAYVNSATVNLSLTYIAYGSTVSHVRYSNDGIWDTEIWELPATSKVWTLNSGDGTRVVYFQIKDSDGMLSSTYSDTIIVNTSAPTGSIVINSGNTYAASTSVILSLTYSSGSSGVLQVRYSNDGIWDTEIWELPTPSRAWNLTLGDGEKTVYFQVSDSAGTLSSTYSDSIILDTSPPQGSIRINSGAAYTNATIVNLTLYAVDAGSGVSQMRFQNDGGAWSIWEPYATSKSWNLSSGDGAKNVYVQFRDMANLTVTAYHTITLDVTPPTANAGLNQIGMIGSAVVFNGSGSYDNLGIASYFWDFGDGSTGIGVTPTHTYAIAGNYTVRLMVKDLAGNSSASSSTVTVEVVVPEFPSTMILVLFTMLASALAAKFGRKQTQAKQVS